MDRKILRRLKLHLTRLRATGADVSEADIAFQFWLGRRYRKAERPHSYGNGTSAEVLNRKRHVRDLKRRLVRSARNAKRNLSIRQDMLIAKRRETPVLDALLPGRSQRWLPILKRPRRNGIREIRLERFSFFEDPVGTLSSMREIAEVECNEVDALLHFDDEHCFDIGPYLVLSEIWGSLSPVFRGGRMASSIQKVIGSVGLWRPLRMGLPGLTDLNDIWAFPLQRRRPANSSRSRSRHSDVQSREKVVDRFIQEVDRWLAVEAERPLGLTDDGKAWIANIIGELLDNCERHSAPESKDGDWSVAAFMARRSENDRVVYRCYMAFLSAGATIEESLETCSEQTRREVERYCGRHRRANRNTSNASLRTLFALQDGVTRDRNADAAGRGGTGLQDVIELVNVLGLNADPERAPRLTIISGSSCIMLKPPYVSGQRLGGEHSPRVIWCNAQNSDMNPPDPAHVFDLPERLAGTLISFSFILDPSHMNETING